MKKVKRYNLYEKAVKSNPSKKARGNPFEKEDDGYLKQFNGDPFK